VKKAGSVVGELIRQGPLRRHISLGEIWINWDKIAGAEFAGQTRPMKVVGRVLYVAVDGAAVHHKVSFIKGNILNRVRAFTGGKYITDIVFQSRSGSGTSTKPVSP
jgi:hypothetical protein